MIRDLDSGLNRSAHRDIPFMLECFKSSHEITLKISKKSFCFPDQGLKPMILTATGNTGEPFAVMAFLFNGGMDGLDTCLEPFEIAVRFEFDQCSTIRATVAFKPKYAWKSVELCCNISMSPRFWVATFAWRPGPWEFFAINKKLLEI